MSKFKFKCECRICKRHEEYARQLNNLKEAASYLRGLAIQNVVRAESDGVEEAIKFFEKIYNDLNNVELDNDVNKAIIEGSWPTADENIKWARIRRKEK